MFFSCFLFFIFLIFCSFLHFLIFECFPFSFFIFSEECFFISFFLYFFEICIIAGIGIRVFNCLLRSRCSMEMWCPDDIGRDSWDWVGPPAWERACFNSPQWGQSSSPVKTAPPLIVLLLLLLCCCCCVDVGLLLCCCCVVVVLLCCCCFGKCIMGVYVHSRIRMQRQSHLRDELLPLAESRQTPPGATPCRRSHRQSRATVGLQSCLH